MCTFAILKELYYYQTLKYIIIPRGVILVCAVCQAKEILEDVSLHARPCFNISK